MAKEIKIGIKDVEKLEFTLRDDASKGDYICLKKVNEIDFLDLEKNISLKEKEIKSKYYEDFGREIESNAINKFKATDTDYIKLLSSSEKIKSLNETIINNLSQYEENKVHIINEYINSKDFNNVLNEKLEILITKNQILEKEISNTNHNSAVIGTELTNWVYNELNKVYGNTNTVIINKEPIPIAGSKPDIIVRFIDEKTKSTKGIIVIENKNQLPSGKGKNSHKFETLNKNKEKFAKTDLSYGLLVSELEPKDIFEIRTIKGYSDMYLVRPFALISFITLLEQIINKNIKINRLNINLKNKQDLRDEFETMKDKAFMKNFDMLAKKSDEMNTEITKISESADKLRVIKNSIFDIYINKIKNKINEFKIDKIIKKIEEINSK